MRVLLLPLLVLGFLGLLALLPRAQAHSGPVPVRVRVPVPGSGNFSYSYSGLDWPGRCQSGLHQSPINIARADALPSRHTLTVSYQGAAQFEVENSGFNVHIKPVPVGGTNSNSSSSNTTNTSRGSMSNRLWWDGVEFRLLQVHAHTLSEHAVDGLFGAMELHYVHASAANATQLLVLATTLRLHPRNTPNAFLDSWRMAHAPQRPGESVTVAAPLSLGPSLVARPAPLPAALQARRAALKPRQQRRQQGLQGQQQQGQQGQAVPTAVTVYTYPGSLSTPSCSEGVTWLVVDPLHGPSLSVAQLEQFDDFFSQQSGGDPHNDRMPQPLDGRVVEKFTAYL